jgi:hypothetical protein
LAVTALGQDSSQVHISTSLLMFGAQGLRISLPEDGSTAGFRNAMLNKKLVDGQNPKEEDYVSGKYTLTSLPPF